MNNRNGKNYMIFSKKKSRNIEDVLLAENGDRRLLSNVPDVEKIRSNVDRRGEKIFGDGNDIKRLSQGKKAGTRFKVDFEALLVCGKSGRKKQTIHCQVEDISSTGLSIILTEEDSKRIEEFEWYALKFEIIPGSMPEGYEMKVNIKAKMVRRRAVADNKIICGMEFNKTLSEYASKKKDRYSLVVASGLLLAVSIFIILMRAESVIYFKFNKALYLYSIIAAVFLLSRYLFGVMYKQVPINPEFTPGVTIIVPCFNEEEWIQRCILSCINQDYPADRIEVIIVDDCSNDQSVEKIKEIVEILYQEANRYQTRDRLKYLVQSENKGKRDALAWGAERAMHELLVFVDSDSFLDPFAIRNIVQPFQDPKMGGVAGRTDVANTYTNGLTKMQAVRYYISFRIMKAAEAYFDAVTCLSGPLSCYRKKIVLDNKEQWLNQTFFGQKATFGDDRSMTNFVLQNHRTSYQDSAVCSTIVPNRYNIFLKQQMRWKRSWLRESLIAGSFIWKKEPFMAVFFYMGLVVPIAAPIVVIYNLIYIPLVLRVFPTTFFVGLLMMALLMSLMQLFMRKSTTWVFGLLFCLYYEAILLWQMPIAWVTFWKSTWGTRMTPQDIEEQRKKDEQREKREAKRSTEDIADSQ
ncbi:glycosyltransferase [Acetobacterium sp. K1/6]|uniref:glycosyltransferase family 2 protein n=1 Tax=Acetobacterium sp. K1/6 TaxID=3055467 RepID=UPI002ACAFCB5|nr:glycosyltransferase [Acetobacterium sp. K1/6]MDZ5723859.1 glycosyltransferase [Acetobacterium sp. K1/6]